MNMKNLDISCISRRYLIKYEGTVMEIDVPKPLERKDMETILKIDAPLKAFLSNCEIISHTHIVAEPEKVKERNKVKERKQRRKGNVESLKEARTKKLREVRAKKSRTTKVNKRIKLAKGLNKRQRIIVMSKMEKLFTRIDYQKYIEDELGIKISNWNGHGDIEEALKARIIEPTGQKIKNPVTNHYVPTYRVVEKISDEEHLLKKLKEGNKTVREIIA